MAFAVRLWLALALAAQIVAPATASAASALLLSQQEPPQVRVNVAVQSEGPFAEEASHDSAYRAALEEVNSGGGFAALQRHVPALTEAFSHAPGTYPTVQEVAGGWSIRADTRDEIMTLAQRIGEVQSERGGGEVKVVARPNVYPNIAFLLASAAVERRDFATAHAVLDAGLALQPLDRHLLNEKLVVLHAERRWEEAYLLVKNALATDDPLLKADPALLQRRLGYTLVELGRLHEARAAYEASLEAEPGNAIALAELEFITNAEQGQSNYGEMQILAPNMPVATSKPESQTQVQEPKAN